MKQIFNFKITRHFIITTILIIITLLAYWHINSYDFIDFDDNVYVYENPVVQKGISFENIKWAFGFSKEAIKFYWHPVTWLSHMTDCQLFGANAGFHHLSNLFFHCLNVLLLFAVLFHMTGGLWQSAFVAALFAVHPINVESVVWIAERKNVLSTFFWMLTMLAYLYYARRPGFRRYMIVIALFILGLMTKPMLVTLPCVFLLLDFWPLRRLDLFHTPDSHAVQKNVISYLKTPVHKLLLEKLPLLLLSFLTIGISVLSIHITRQIVPGNIVPLSLRIENALVCYVKYIAMIIRPHEMAVFYPFPDVIPLWQPIAAGLILIAISIGTLIFIKKAPWLIIGWLWYLGTMFPVIGISQHGLWPEMADRWAYIPEIGLFVMIVWGGAAITAKIPYRKMILSFLAGAVILACIIITRHQTAYWKNSITLFRQTLDVTSSNFPAHNNIGKALAQKGRLNEAISHFYAATKLEPVNDEYRYNLATALAKKGLLSDAIIQLQTALKINPNNAKANNNLGWILGQKGQFDEAISLFNASIKLNPDYAKAYANLADIYAKSGHPDKAVSTYRQAIRLEPINVQVYVKLGTVLVHQNKIREGIQCFKQAIAINPYSEIAKRNLAQLTGND